MTERLRAVRFLLLALSVAYPIAFVGKTTWELMGSQGLLFGNGTPIGGDFINMWSAARMLLEGLVGSVYRVKDFMAYEGTVLPSDIGLRLWAYPPQSLLLVWPLGYLGFFEALALWSALGMTVLWAGLTRLGFDRQEAAIVLVSPASLSCLYYGQTGNLAAGLLLLALSVRSKDDKISIVSAALLTIKPQTGFLLPLLWFMQRRWRLIVWASLLTLAMLGLTLALFGTDVWQAYVNDSLSSLNRLEQGGSGPFMLMIPSAFMSLRILTGDGTLAGGLHLAFAALVGAALVWRLRKVEDVGRQNAHLLLGAALMTPYLHNYDLALVLCGGLIVLRRHAQGGQPESRPVLLAALVVLAWALPNAVVIFNALGAPISPLIILLLFCLA